MQQGQQIMSSYYQQLHAEDLVAASRYEEKIQIIDGVDPYTIEDLNYDLSGAPPVCNMDIVVYLVLTHSYYTKDQMKAFKSLEAYKYFEAGFVQGLGYKTIKEHIVVVGKVKHSQCMNKKPLNPWIIFEEDGSVVTAHCTCVAGTSEVCSHVGAALYALEYANNLRKNISCTDTKASWLVPTTSKLPVVPISEMEWGKTGISKFKDLDVPTLAGDGIVNLLKTLQTNGCNSGLMRIVQPFASELEENEQILDSVLDVFDINNESKSYEDLLKLSCQLNLSIEEHTINAIEEQTQSQHKSADWYKQRAGRITASNFKAACRTSITKPSLSLIKIICYPTKVKFTSKFTRWGINHEDAAVEAYIGKITNQHEDFIVNRVGFYTSTEWPQFGASPDRLVFCECCLGGCVEVKCPYLLHSKKSTLEEYAKQKSSCLTIADGTIKLNKKHCYYYQVQMQLFVTGLQYCDFVVWAPKTLFIERIKPDLEFWEVNSKKALAFHTTIIMPELLGRYFTRGQDTDVLRTAAESCSTFMSSQC